MTHSTAGSLWTIDDTETYTEVINDERTRVYNKLHPFWSGNNCDGCGCPALNYNPSTGAALVYGASPDAGTPAPWYTAAAAADSADFLGFVVSDIDGLDYSHLERTVTQRAGRGAQPTPLRLAGREITFTMLATAQSEAGMRYGLDWLANRLANIGGRCGYGRASLKLYCPETPTAYSAGRVEIREVSLIRGPMFTSSWLRGAGHMVREVMFTILAGDPCFYTARSSCLAAVNHVLPQINLNLICTDTATVAELLCGPVDPYAVALNAASPCCELAVVQVLDARAATVTIQMISGTAGPWMIESWSGAPASTCASVVAGTGTLLGRIGVDSMSGTEGLQVDSVTGIIWSRTSGAAPWVPDDSLLLFPDNEVPYFPWIAGTNSLYVAVRPYHPCDAGGTFQTTIQSTSVLTCIGG